MPGEDDGPGRIECYSSPCFQSEHDSLYGGQAPGTASLSRENVMAWRKSERKRLIADRLASQARTRFYRSVQIAAHLDVVIDDPGGLIVSAYWPFRGEPNLHPWLDRLVQRGGRAALPVVLAKRAPMVFRLWKQGDKLDRGIWNIPIPANGAEVIPDIVIAPLVGFDRAGFRLGYGGGFFDRTLASLSKRPTVIGVGYAKAAIPTIHPLPHDIAMDIIVTETGSRRRA